VNGGLLIADNQPTSKPFLLCEFISVVLDFQRVCQLVKALLDKGFSEKE
jgi:hypothetical protein